MILLDELHVVSATIGGETHRLATANLNGNVDTLATLRGRVVRSHLIDLDDEAVGIAFDEAFEACERIPGDGATGTVDGKGFILIVRRTLEG